MNFQLATINKAIAGALASSIVSFLMKKNVVIADGLHDAIEVIIAFIIGLVVVYFAPKNKEVK